MYGRLLEKSKRSKKGAGRKAALAGGAGHMLSQFAMGDDEWMRKAADEEDDEEKEEAAREKKIEAENNAGAEDEDDGDEDAAEERKERARDSFNASMTFGAVIHKANAHKYVSRSPDGKGGWRYRYASDVRRNLGSIAEARVMRDDANRKAAFHGQQLVAARQRRGKPGFLARITGGRSDTHEMDQHARDMATARETADMIAEADAFHRTGQEYDDVQSVGDAMLEAFVRR